MGRFYADLAALRQDELLGFTIQYTHHVMPLVESFLNPDSTTDSDGDVVMIEALPGSPVSAFKENFGPDCYRTESNSPMKSPLGSPVSPTTTAKKLSISTASPTNYFLESSNHYMTPDYALNTLSPTQPLRFSQVILLPPPLKPLNWVWQCHMCRSRYSLSVTRRCLIDGHYYCSGDTSQRNSKRKRRQQSCTSEFDYVGWQDWGQWRRKCTALRDFANGKAAPKLDGCDGCSYPSQCRYENRPLSETIEFNNFISADEITAMKNKEAKIIVSPERKALNEGLLIAPSDQENDTGDDFAYKTARKLKESSLHDHEKGRQSRFYSTLTGDFSSTDLSPTEERTDPFEKGRFDPQLPSVNEIPTSSLTFDDVQNNVMDHDEEVQAIESTPKSMLNDKKVNLPHGQGRKQRNTTANIFRGYDQRRDLLNEESSKTLGREHNAEHYSISKTNLMRSDSQQSLFLDWYKSRRSRDGHGDLHRPSSEADIISFLRQRTTRRSVDDDTTCPERLSTKEYASSNFEDIGLSPVERRSSSFADILPEHNEVNQRHSSRADDSKIGSQRRPSSTFGFPTFNFSRQ